MLDKHGLSASRQVERADTIIEKLEDKMETIEDNLDKMADMVHSVRDDAERIKGEVHRQVSRARQQTLNKIAAYETGQGAIAQAAAAPAAAGALQHKE